MRHTQKRIYFLIPIALFLFLSQVSLPVSRVQDESRPFDLRNDPEVKKIIAEFRSSIPEILKKEKDLPGLSVALVDRKGAVWTEGFGFLSVLRWFPELGFGIVILTNSVNHSSVHGSLANQIVNEIIALKSNGNQIQPYLPKKKEAPPIEMSPGALQNYAGYYQGRGIGFQLKIEDGKLGIELNKQFYPLTFHSDTHVSTENYDYKFVLNAKGRPSYIIRFSDGLNLDYVDGPADKPGPDKPEWKKYVGTYRYRIYGKLRGVHRVHMKNGYLYFDRLRLVEEYQPGLFFSTTGEALDFRGEIPTWRNIKLEKTS